MFNQNDSECDVTLTALPLLVRPADPVALRVARVDVRLVIGAAHGLPVGRAVARTWGHVAEVTSEGRANALSTL